MISRPPRCLFVAFVFLLSAFCLLPGVRGQSSSATLSGTVEDQNSAVVPGATIVVLNTATSFKRQATTSDQGSFTVPLLPPGVYTVTVRRDGFTPLEIREVVLNVGDQKALNIQLKAGDVNATVTVDSSAETVRTDGSVGTVVDRQFVANIPLNGRSLQALIQLTPGIALTPIQAGTGTATGGAQFSVNGQRTTANYFMVDGVSANTGVSAGFSVLPYTAGSGQTPGTTALGGTNSLVSLDALQEFRIETSTYAPEFGRTPGGQISLLTRGGTNQFHGSASYYFRNEALDANDWFANARRLPKPKERQHLFGGVLGGPIRRERLFFFGSYEGLRLKQPNVRVESEPTTAVRSQAAPALRPYLNALPVPNGKDLGNGKAEFAASYSDPGSFNVFGLRLDARMTNTLTGFFRVSHTTSDAKQRAFGALSTVRSVQARNRSYTGGFTWVVDPSLTGDVRINWTRNQGLAFSNLDAFGGAVVPQASDIFLAGRDPSTAAFSFNALGAGFNWGVGSSDEQRQFNAVGMMAKVISSHQLKFGVDYRRLLPLLGGGGGSFETLQFSTTAQITAAQVFSYSVSNSDPVPREPIISSLSLFAQDTWRVHRRLTLTYGLRFERVPSPTEASGRLPRTLLGIDSDVLQNPRLAPAGTPLFRRRFGEFAPRFGAAYQLRTRPGLETTLRGGLGIFYDLGLGNVANGFSVLYPFFAVKQVRNVPFPLSAADRTPPVLGVDPPQRFFLLDPNLRMPYTVEWNATWQQGLGSAQTVTVAYVGAAGRRLLAAVAGDSQPLAEWPTVRVNLVIQRNISQSNYNALQVQYQRPLRRGMQALASYTLGHSRDNASADFNAVSLTPNPTSRADLFGAEWGASDFDVRHVLSGALTYEVPKLSGPALLQALTRNWGLDLLVRYQSAFPVNVTPGFAPSANILTRPDLVPGQPLYINDPTVPGGRRFNAAAFTIAPSDRQGNFPRNGLRGFPASQVDLALRREFKLRESIRLQLRAELFNLFNHPNFGAPDNIGFNSIFDPTFGRSTSMLNRSLGGLNALYQMGGPRSGQLAIKVIW
jgi:hypothetical protein